MPGIIFGGIIGGLIILRYCWFFVAPSIAARRLHWHRWEDVSSPDPHDRGMPLRYGPLGGSRSEICRGCGQTRRYWEDPLF